MSHATLTRLMADARMRLPGALDAAIQQELFGVLDEFFQESSVWREVINVNVTTSKLLYEIESEEVGAEIVRLLDFKTADGNHWPVTMEVPGELVLTETPSAAETMVARVVLTVGDPVKTDGYPNAPAWVTQKYRAGLLDGLLAKLMSQPAKPYASERLSIYHMRRFRNAIAKASVDAQHANLHGGQSWQFPQSFATGR